MHCLAIVCKPLVVASMFDGQNIQPHARVVCYLVLYVVYECTEVDARCRFAAQYAHIVAIIKCEMMLADLLLYLVELMIMRLRCVFCPRFMYNNLQQVQLAWCSETISVYCTCHALLFLETCQVCLLWCKYTSKCEIRFLVSRLQANIIAVVGLVLDLLILIEHFIVT